MSKPLFISYIEKRNSYILMLNDRECYYEPDTRVMKEWDDPVQAWMDAKALFPGREVLSLARKQEGE